MMEVGFYKKNHITIFSGEIEDLIADGFAIYGTQGQHMLAKVKNGKVFVMNEQPYVSLDELWLDLNAIIYMAS